MTYANEKQEVVGIISTREDNEIRVLRCLDEDHNLKSIDIRNWYRLGDCMEMMPTRKGIRIPATNVGELIDLLKSSR